MIINRRNDKNRWIVLLPGENRTAISQLQGVIVESDCGVDRFGKLDGQRRPDDFSFPVFDYNNARRIAGLYDGFFETLNFLSAITEQVFCTIDRNDLLLNNRPDRGIKSKFP